MGRLPGFDYKSPFYYMVTLKRLKGLAAFSEIGERGVIAPNAITRAFEKTIRSFHRVWRCCDEISPFAIMPDHLHLLMKIRPTPDRVALGVLVSQLAKALRRDYWNVVAADAATCKTLASPTVGYCRSRVCATVAPGLAGCASAQPRGLSRETPQIFDPSWHDWIVKKNGQLAAFRRYIRENAFRAWQRRAHPEFFGRVTAVSFLGRRWFAYGNAALLELPVLVPFKGHRATAEGSPDWNAALAAASRIGPGGAGVSTFMSPLEKACGNAIAKAGGALIVLSPEGFSERWHPPRKKERFCAQGRMLFLSLYEATRSQPTRAQLYSRCHEMVDLALSGLS